MSHRPVIYFFCIVFLSVGLDVPASVFGQPPLRHTEQLPPNKGPRYHFDSIFDRAIGFMDAGEMKVVGVENFGLLSGWDPPNTAWYPGAKHGAWGELRWIAPVLCMPPGSWGAMNTNGPSLPEDRSDQYNSIESFSCMHLYDGDNYSYADWEAKDNAATYYHGWITEDNIPMIAISTLQESWPQGYFDDNNVWNYTPGEYHWPGGWALDPDPTSPTYNQPLEGRFVSSKDIYFLADDKYNGVRAGAVTARYGYPVGIDMEVAGYSYSSPLYEDVVFFNINFIYRTREQITNPESRFYDPDRHFYDGPIDSVYFAFFVDPDLPGAFTANNQQTHPWAEDDYALVYDWDHDGTIDVFLAFDKQDYNVDETRPQNAGPVSAYGINFFRTPRVNPSDPNSAEIGITGFHWFDQDDAMRPHEVTADWEKVLYAISAGRPDLIADEADKWFHGDNPKIDDVDLLRDFQEGFPVGSRPDIQFWFSSGPFTISPGDTIPIHIGIVGGLPNPGGYDEQGFPLNTDPEVRFADVFDNLGRADELYEHNFQGSGPPDAPTLQAVGTLVLDADRNPVVYGENEKVTLYWDDKAEHSTDIITRERDFEGYKIYRAFVDPRATRELDWGDEIYDYDGEVVGYVPRAQFDLDNSWSGRDPYNPFFNLGDNTGLQYTWTDNSVTNGVRYRYSITAYDHPDTVQGIGAQETTIGFDPKEIHIVDVIPGLQPEGYHDAEADSNVLHVTGSGTGSISLDVINSMDVTGHTYQITFADTSVPEMDELSVTVTDVDLHWDIILNSPSIWDEAEAAVAEPRPIVDGIGLTIINHNVIEMLSQEWQVVTGDTSDYEFSALVITPDEIRKPSDYQIVFGDSSSKFSQDPLAAYVPFQVFNITEDPERTTPIELYVRNPRSAWTSGDFVYLLEPDVDHRTWQFSITWPPEASAPPQSGDIYLYRTKKPFTSEDIFTYSTQPLQANLNEATLDRIKVVPNPYIVSSGTELYARGDVASHDLRFTHLPPECTIRIYTLRGDLVKTIHHNSQTIGEAHWDLLTEEHLEISYGIYVYTVTTPKGDKKIDKFAVIW